MNQPLINPDDIRLKKTAATDFEDQAAVKAAVSRALKEMQEQNSKDRERLSDWMRNRSPIHTDFNARIGRSWSSWS